MESCSSSSNQLPQVETSSETSSSSRFSLRSKSIFLTFPQCDFSLEEFQTNLIEFFGDILKIGICCQEEHEDEGLHLHAAISLSDSFRTTNPRVFDKLVSPPKHPNIQKRFTGGVAKAFAYVAKDGNWLPLPADKLLEVQEILKTKQKISEKIVKAIKSGQTLDEIDEDHPTYLLLNLKRVRDYSDFQGLKSKRSHFAEASLQKVFVRAAPGYSNSSNRAIAGWLRQNIRQTRSHRQKQLWIQAPPGAGKTSLILMLEKEFNLSVYYWPKDEQWMDGYSDGAYDLILLDEFRAQKRITDLNPILSGDPTPVSRRGSAPVIKRDILPVIILSNFNPHECFHKCTAAQIAPLVDRLTIVICDSFIRIIPISELEWVNFLIDENESDDEYPPLQPVCSPEPVPLIEYPMFGEGPSRDYIFPWSLSAIERLDRAVTHAHDLNARFMD